MYVLFRDLQIGYFHLNRIELAAIRIGGDSN